MAKSGEDSFEIIEESEKKIFDLTQISFKKYISINDATLRFIKKLENKTESYIKTGLYDLDTILRMNKSDLIVIAARPSIGKTSLALDYFKKYMQNKTMRIFQFRNE